MTYRLMVVLGTRPEIIKLGPVISALPETPTVVHTGQHYDPEMSDVFFKAFAIPQPTHRLSVGGETRAQQVSQAIGGLDRIFEIEEPDAVVVQGDTNTTMAAALAANARSIPLVHVEAGLRSHDRRMPEEHNRVVTDHLADLCLAPTPTSAENLRNEGIPESRVEVTGNTVVDAVLELLPSPTRIVEAREAFGVTDTPYVLSTFHRPENVDDPGRLETIVSELATLEIPVVFPVHPRTLALAKAHGIDLQRGEVHIYNPIDYLTFLSLMAGASLIIADSGGLQEEVSVLKKPMVVVRRSTERPEVVGTFCVRVEAGEAISRAAVDWLNGVPHSPRALDVTPSPYGDGDAGKRSAAAIQNMLG